jgi:hypothetical protein
MVQFLYELDYNVPGDNEPVTPALRYVAEHPVKSYDGHDAKWRTSMVQSLAGLNKAAMAEAVKIFQEYNPKLKVLFVHSLLMNIRDELTLNRSSQKCTHFEVIHLTRSLNGEQVANKAVWNINSSCSSTGKALPHPKAPPGALPRPFNTQSCTPKCMRSPSTLISVGSKT